MMEILLTGLGAGVLVTWFLFRRIARNEKHPQRIINMHYQTIKNKKPMKRFTMIMLLAIIVFSCSPCRKVSNENGYMVWAIAGVNENNDCVSSAAEADAYIYKVSGLPVVTDSLMGKRKRFFYLDNGDWEIYVAEEKAWKRRRK